MHALGCLPVVCDTAYLSFETTLVEWFRRSLAVASQNQGCQVVLRQRPHEVASGIGVQGSYEPFDPALPPPGLCWKVKAGRLVGFSAFDHIATGQGPWHGVRMLIGPSRRTDPLPNARRVFLMLSSELLWMRHGQGSGVYQTVREVIDCLGVGSDGQRVFESLPLDDEIEPSRIDLCVDHWGYPWEIADLQKFSCRQTKRGYSQAGDEVVHESEVTESGTVFNNGHKSFTLYTGARGNQSRFMRVYDKTGEAASSGKLPWLEPIWARYGWREGMRVWRAEVEHGGGWLRSHGCKTLLDLRGGESALWNHYVQTVKHTEGQTTRLHRAKISRVWDLFQRATHDLENGTWEWTPRRVVRGKDMDHLLSMAAGCMQAVEEFLLSGANVLRPSITGQNTPWDPDSVRPREEIRAEALALLEQYLDQKQKGDDNGVYQESDQPAHSATTAA